MLTEYIEPRPSRFWVEVPSALAIKAKGDLVETATGLTLEVVDPWGNRVGFADYSKKKELARREGENPLDMLVRQLQEGDVLQIVHRFSFPWSKEEKTIETWQTYLKEQSEGPRKVFLVEKEGHIFGYGSLLYKSKYEPFLSLNIPEIQDVWIDASQRKKGFGQALLKTIEGVAHSEGYKEIGIGVGLYRDYGSAQQLYFKRGYVPDGEGITYQYKKVTPGKSYPLDDELVLWLKKALV